MVMVVVVLMTINRKCASSLGAKQFQIFRRSGHMFRCPLTADMTIQANHPVGSCHDHMQFMAHHQNRASKLVPYQGKPVVECCRASLIKALSGLIQDQKVRIIQQGAGQHHALKFTA